MSESTFLKRFLGLATAVLILSLFGYGGYILYPRFDLKSAAASGLLPLAVMAGVASLFSPCSFPLLLTLLAGESSGNGRLLRSVGAFSIGAALFLLLTGLALALGAGGWIARFTFTSAAGRTLRLLVGLALIGFGVWQLQGRSLNVGWLNQALQPLWYKQTKLRHQKSTLSYGLYGFGYILAGFG
ncbi:MAG: hypothetical protein H6656_21750 [Ardenticatenaceae bacterium]|nr:hypothetical protein [Anaerolineales bacterium]MCB9009961.1 hypothetical protein [Ardenticatenaceae bacterium]